MGRAVCDGSALAENRLTMKIAVTGGSGFIGRHVLAELGKHKVDIVAVTRKASHLENVAGACRVEEMDLAQPPVNCFERLGRPDVLIHLAWDGLPNYNSLHHFESELPRQYGFLKIMIEAGLPSLVVTGTCFEYGMQSGGLAASLDPKPANPYGHAKNALRQQLEYLRALHSFNLTWGRLFYMYGEGQHKASLYPQLKEAVSRGDKVFNMSGGEQLRDYLPVKEVAKQIVHLAIAGQEAGVVNICSGRPISVRKLVEQWLLENGWNIQLNLGHYPYPDYEPMAFWGVR